MQSVYELLTAIKAPQKRQGNRLNEIAATQAEHGQKLDSQGEKLDAILDLLRGRDES